MPSYSHSIHMPKLSQVWRWQPMFVVVVIVICSFRSTRSSRSWGPDLPPSTFRVRRRHGFRQFRGGAKLPIGRSFVNWYLIVSIRTNIRTIFVIWRCWSRLARWRGGAVSRTIWETGAWDPAVQHRLWWRMLLHPLSIRPQRGDSFDYHTTSTARCWYD